MSAIVVEQNAQKILGVTDRAVILERGAIVHEGESAALQADRATLEQHLGVTATAAARGAASIDDHASGWDKAHHAPARFGVDAGPDPRFGSVRTPRINIERRHAADQERDRPMNRTTPPFRADHVGSFLRPAALKDARAKREKGEITAAQLKEVEDREIETIIRKQEEVGLKLATDGEFRRSWWHFDFFGMLDGVEIYELDHGIQFQGVQTKPQSIRVTGKLGFSSHPMLEHFKLPEGQYTRHAEDDDPEPERAAFPARAERGPQAPIPASRRHLRRSRRRPTGRPSRPSTTPAAATCSSTTPPGPICAPRRSWRRRRRAA